MTSEVFVAGACGGGGTAAKAAALEMPTAIAASLNVFTMSSSSGVAWLARAALYDRGGENKRWAGLRDSRPLAASRRRPPPAALATLARPPPTVRFAHGGGNEAQNSLAVSSPAKRREVPSAMFIARGGGGAGESIDLLALLQLAASRRKPPPLRATRSAPPTVASQRGRKIKREACRQFPDRKSTRLNSSHVEISYAVFCLKKKNKKQHDALKGKKNRRNKHTRT